jgi:predicted dithiol-disulfide oxidoreductase (DUF899 family)
MIRQERATWTTFGPLWAKHEVINDQLIFSSEEVGQRFLAFRPIKHEKATGQTYYDYTVQQFPSEERPGASVFYKDDDGDVFHTYSTYGRGLDILIGAYNWLDMAPKGRDEEGLPHGMAWVRHHDKYADSQRVDPNSLLLARKA